MLNLITNGLDSLDAGGTVTVAVERERRSARSSSPTTAAA